MTIDRRTFMGTAAWLGIASVTGFRKFSRTPFPELTARGEPGDLGFSHGKKFASRIRFNLNFYLKWLSDSGRVKPDRLLELAKGFRDTVSSHFPAFMEEMDGISRGAGLKTEEILLINARTDLAALIERETRQRKIPACTAMAQIGGHNGSRILALGQNWDWDTQMAKSPVILRLSPDDAPTMVILTEAGMLAKIGFNEHRLGVCLNFLSHRTDGRPGRFGIPVHCLLRAVLNCQTIQEVINMIRSLPRCASANFLLAQHDRSGPRAVDMEITPDDTAILEMKGQFLIHTNHFLDSRLAVGCTSGRGPSTINRFNTATGMAEELEKTEPDPVKRIQRILSSRKGIPYCISRKGNPDPSSTTLSGIIMDLSRNRLILTSGPPHENPWIPRPGTQMTST